MGGFEDEDRKEWKCGTGVCEGITRVIIRRKGEISID
jgi:hypothetical protein